MVRRDVLSDETVQKLAENESDDPFADLAETKLHDISSNLPQCNYEWAIGLKMLETSDVFFQRFSVLTFGRDLTLVILGGIYCLTVATQLLTVIEMLAS